MFIIFFIILPVFCCIFVSCNVVNQSKDFCFILFLVSFSCWACMSYVGKFEFFSFDLRMSVAL